MFLKFSAKISCILLDFEPKNKIIWELEIFQQKVQPYSFRPPRKCKLTKQALWYSEKLQGIV